MYIYLFYIGSTLKRYKSSTYGHYKHGKKLTSQNEERSRAYVCHSGRTVTVWRDGGSAEVHSRVNPTTAFAVANSTGLGTTCQLFKKPMRIACVIDAACIQLLLVFMLHWMYGSWGVLVLISIVVRLMTVSMLYGDLLERVWLYLLG